MPAEDGSASAALEDDNPRLECKQCGTSKTPMWRSGPLGPKTLCNACGVRAQRAHQRTRTGPAGSPSKDKAGQPFLTAKSEPLSSPPASMYCQSERGGPRQPPRPSPQPMRPLSQRISRRQSSKVYSEDEAEISSDDDDAEADLLDSQGGRAAKRKHEDSTSSFQDVQRRSARPAWLLHQQSSAPANLSLGCDEITHGAHPSPGSQASGQSSLDQGRRAASNGSSGPGASQLPRDPNGPHARRPHSGHQHLWITASGQPGHASGPSNGMQHPGSTGKLACLPGHLITRNKSGLQKIPNIRLLVRVAALGTTQPGPGALHSSGGHQLLVLSCIVQDGREAAVCAIPRQGLAVVVSMPVANANGNGYRWESPQGWLVHLPERQSALQLAGILKKWLGPSMENGLSSAPQLNGGGQTGNHIPSPGLQQRPFGRHCEWECKADQAAAQWWTELFRSNPDRAQGQELPLALLERLLDTLELASASLRLPQGIPESAARAVLGNCCWAPAGAVCKAVFTYWLDRRQGQALQGLGTERLWQRTWPPMWQASHPLSPLAGILSPLIGLPTRQPAESVLSNRISPEGSQAATSLRPASDRGPRGSQPGPGLAAPASSSRLAGPDLKKATSAPCAFMSNFVPQDQPHLTASMDADFAGALCRAQSGADAPDAVAAPFFPSSPLLIQPPLAQEAQQQRVISQESASASPGTSDSHQHSLSTLSTALSAPLFSGPLPTDHLMTAADELDMLGNFELAGSELLADVEAASFDLFNAPQAK